MLPQLLVLLLLNACACGYAVLMRVHPGGSWISVMLQPLQNWGNGICEVQTKSRAAELKELPDNLIKVQHQQPQSSD